MSKLQKLKKELNNLANIKQKEVLQRFFKTGPGEYGEGDVFLGIKVPEQRRVAKEFNDLSLDNVQSLLNSKTHDHRMVALFILIDQYNRGDEKDRKTIFDFYLKNTRNINNWDLIDLSAPKIVGDYLINQPRKILYKLARSKDLWKKRIAVLSTFTFIKENQFEDTLKISEILLYDDHDLIHKAVGWMLREVGKRDQVAEEIFLNKYHKTMPRTMLRYAIEKLDESKRKFYMKGD
jgi:3-methyladenine DNA glycosylase AlkD